MIQQPGIGRIVHYQSYGTVDGKYLPAPRAAVITAVLDSLDGATVSLAVLNPTGLLFDVEVPHAKDDVPTPGHWNWPPRI